MLCTPISGLAGTDSDLSSIDKSVVIDIGNDIIEIKAVHFETLDFVSTDCKIDEVCKSTSSDFIVLFVSELSLPEDPGIYKQADILATNLDRYAPFRGDLVTHNKIDYTNYRNARDGLNCG